ncbi:protein ECT2-like [Xenia sp. Carnegie-2017]|uniref:protein ECT2-like n=1 Tax=Xenia sp. Carnegie-2017 TaxID=2897299 RepID=UPI001F03699C|nr:protein ECT2-like [Xenia sp. Carnegie-2017]
MEQKLPPFSKCCFTFVGFSEEEKARMEEKAIQHGGKICNLESKKFTHIVVKGSDKEIPQDALEVKNVKIVKQELFRASIQDDARGDSGSSLLKKRNNRKRSREKETEDSSCHPPKKKSNDILSESSYSGMISPPTNELVSQNRHAAPVKDVSPPKPKTMREKVALELLKNEQDYVETLDTIMSALEQRDATDGAILAQGKIDRILGNLPHIKKIHYEMMVELQNLISSWTEDMCIGNVILKHVVELRNAYPEYVNSFQMRKETAVKCDKGNQRFKEFQKICLSQPEFGRQKFPELLIKPVQKLPSMNLILKRLLKETRKANSNNPDIVHLEKAIEALESVLTHINECKKEADSEAQMFILSQIMQDIENCPQDISSNGRSFVVKIDGFRLSDEFGEKAQPVTLFLFNDSLEVTKRRSKVASFRMKGSVRRKPYEHLKFIRLSELCKVVDITEQGENHNLFGFMYSSSDEKNFPKFRLESNEITKEEWLDNFVTSLANVASVANRDECIIKRDANELKIKKSDLS